MDEPHLYMAVIGIAGLITGVLLMLGYMMYMLFIGG